MDFIDFISMYMSILISAVFSAIFIVAVIKRKDK